MPKNRISPHDRFMKQMMSQPKIIQEFFEANLPEAIKQMVDLSTIEPQRESFISDKLHLQIADLLYAVKINNEPGYLYLLVEHMSTYDRLLPFRMLKYVIAVMDNHLRKTGSKQVPVVYPILVYTGKKKYPYSLDLFDLFENNKQLAKQALFEPCQLLDIGNTPDEDLKKFRLFGTMAWIMKHVRDPSFEPVLVEVFQVLKKLDDAGEIEYTDTTISYIVETAEIPNIDVFMEAVKTLESFEEDKLMTLAEQWKQQGFQKGIKTGIDQGFEKGIYQGKVEAAHDIALNFLKLGIAQEQIAQATGLPLEEIENLKKQIH